MLISIYFIYNAGNMQNINLFFTFFIICFSQALLAQDFEVSPVIMEFTVDPGESQVKMLSIKNHSNFKTPFTITFADFGIDIDGKKQVMKRNSSSNSCSEWITPEKTFFDINPNEQIDLKITMEAPSDDNQDRWAIMYIQTVKVKSSFDVDKGLGAGVHLSGRISVQIFRNSVSEITPKVSIKYLKEVNEPDSEDRKFSVFVENEGSTIANCTVMFIASDLSTGEEFEFDQILIESFPGYPREVEFVLPETLPQGEYSLVALLDYGINTTIKGTRLKETLIILDKEDQE